MIRNTKNFNLKKPEQGDFYNVDDFNDNSDIIDAELESRKKAQEDDEKNIKGLTNPEYDDSGTVSGIDSFPAFLNKTKSKMNIFQWYRDFKAGMQFVLHAGQIVNNCVSSDADKPLAAAQGKALQDQLTKLYSDMSKFDVYHRDVTGSLNDDKIIQTALEDFKTSIVTNKPILVEIQNHLGGRALAVGIQSLSNYNSFLVITYYDRPKEFVYSMNQWQVRRLVAPLGMEYGTTDMNRTPGQVTTKHITFQNRLSAFPKVFVCPHTKSPDDTTVSASEATYDGFDIYCYSKAAKEPLAISWMAWY